MPSSSEMRRRNGYEYKKENLLRAVVIDWPNGSAPAQPVGRKYHNIKDTTPAIAMFMRMVKKNFPAATHVNFYGGVSEKFIKRENLSEWITQ